MSEEERLEAMRAVLGYFLEEAKENRLVASLRFAAWLRSEEGCVMWPWIWKEGFRDVMVDVAYHAMRILDALLGVSG